MANPVQNFPKFLTVLSIILIVFSSGLASAGGDCGISVYWGQNNAEGSLRDACASGLYKYINLAYFVISGDGSGRNLNLDGHCFDPIITCPLISLDVSYCQSLGIKVLLSLSGGVSDDSSQKSAKELADHIWNWYLGGWSIVRPLGHTPLDGVDFAVTRGPSQYYLELAKALKQYSTAERKVYLSASSKCQTSGNNLRPAVAAGVFDYVWVQFYNDSTCDYSGGIHAVVVAWIEWSLPLPSGTQLFMGLPASPAAAKSGYIPADVLVDKLLPLTQFDAFGGVMIWNRYFDKGYSKRIIGAFCRKPKDSTLISQLI